MLYKDLEDCEQCPFMGELCNGGYTSSPSGTPIEPPCTCFEPDEDLDELYEHALDSRRRYEDYLDKKDAKEEAIKLKKATAAKKRASTERYCWEENGKLSRLKKRLRATVKLNSFLSSLASAVNFANEAFGYKERAKPKTDLEKEIETICTEIARVKEAKKVKIKEFHAKLKEKEAHNAK